MKRFVLLFLIWAVPCLAEEAVSESHGAARFFQSGVEASRRGVHDQALGYFLDARAEGMTGPALYYNIGVCFYKLERYMEAEESFRKTAEFPATASLAHYNLGLIFLKQSDNKRAAHWFHRAYSGSQNEKLRLLAAAALDLIQRQQKEDDGKISWAQYASLGLGYDDNVELLTQTETSQTSGQGDFFTEILGHIGGSFRGSPPGSSVHLHINAYLLHYFDMGDYDISSVSLGLLYKKKTDKFQLEGGGEYAYTLLDNQSFEHIPTMSLQVKYPLQVFRSLLRFRYRLSYLDILDSDYEYLAGWRQQMLAESAWKWSGYSASIGYVLEVNSRDDSDYSPTRHSVKGAFSIRPISKMKVSFSGGYRKSDYDISGGVDRDEERFRADVRFSFYLNKHWELNGEYQHTENDSNFEEYNYTRNMVILSVGRRF